MPASDPQDRTTAGSPPTTPSPRPDPAAQRPTPVRRRRALIAWALVFVWAAVIWTLGSDRFSSSATSPDILEWLRWLISDLDWRTRARLLVWIRKSAHFIEYAILAALTFRAALLSASRNQLATAIWVALFVVATLATADEARQAFSPDRTGSSRDVMIDLTGGVVTITGLYLVSRRMRTPQSVLDSPS